MNASFLLVSGLLVTSALTVVVTSDEELSSVLNPHQKFDSDQNNVITNMTTASTSNHSDTNNSTITPSAETADVENETSAATPTTSLTTPEPIVVPKTTKSAITRDDHKLITTAAPVSDKNDITGIIIISVIIIAALGFGVGCYIARRRGRRNSVDFTSRPDETNIPLNAEVTQSPEVLVPEIAEPDKAAVDPGAESAAPDICDDDPKEEVVQQQSPPPPVTVAEDGNNASKKSSAESLQETATNNNHQAD
ncbi:uncharacterized protein LOC114469373 [Gouania willdenowi]|uniref:uncharacterized protein LOC114469373 n=1 Tax=Gouania willdenowi TaxID=441366 RepID=UPI001056447E|nr:uncharacterized protein LOC114469373 [Gouania willdenowi]